MVAVLEKADEHVNFEKFSAQPEKIELNDQNKGPCNCCTIL